MKSRINKSAYGYLFVSPFFLIFILFGAIPILYTFYLSFTDWGGFSDPVFIGLANYKRLLHDTFFFKSLFNTLVIWIVSIVPQLTVALFLAIVLNEKFIRGKHIFRAVYYFPNIVSSITLGLLFSLLFDWQTGSVNKLLLHLGLIDKPFNWLGSPWWSRIIVGLVTCWQYFGFNMLVFIAGLQSISREIYEAAEVDGATKVQSTLHITLPLLRPVFLFTLITSVIGGLQLFQSALMIGNGPDNSTLTMVMYLFETSFQHFQYGYGSAVAYGIFVIVMFFTLVTMKASKLKNGEAAQ